MPPAKPADDLDDLERAALAAIDALKRMVLATVTEFDARGRYRANQLDAASVCVEAAVRLLRQKQEARDA